MMVDEEGEVLQLPHVLLRDGGGGGGGGVGRTD